MRAAAFLVLVLLVAPGVAAIELFGPQRGRCTPTLESRLGEERVTPFTDEPEAGKWRTWSVHVGDVLVPPPPAALSAQAAAERAEVERRALERTPEELEAARAWSEGPASAPWERLALDLLAEQTLVDSALNPPRIARHLAILETTLHDALVLAWEAKYCYRRGGPDGAAAPSYPSEHAVVAGAAASILATMYPMRDATAFDALALEAAESRITLGANYRSDVDEGLALGREVARLALERRAGDGSAAASAPVPVPSGPCIWSATLPAFKGPLEPGWGKVRPFALARGDAARPPPPPACGSSDYVAQVDALHAASLALTDEEKDIATRWAGGPGTDTPPGMAVRDAHEAGLAKGLGTMRHARLMATTAAAVADAGIAAWDAKYAYWSERPIHAIRLAHDPAWLPFIDTPPFPGYVSGHATFSGAAAEVLSAFFPEDEAAIRAEAQEAADSRFYGGIHIEADNEVGLQVGRLVGQAALARALT